MANVWYTSDPHFRHRLVAKIRGFVFPGGDADVDGHDNHLIKYWHRTVKKDDTVFVLGDLSVSQHSTALDIISRLPGEKVLISGNHDLTHPDFRRDSIKAGVMDMYNSVFKAVHPFLRRKVNDHEFLLSHFPYSGDHNREDRFDQYRLRDYGVPLLHGHTHGTETTYGHQMHVGWDAWGRFINQEEVAEWLSTLHKTKVRK